MIYKNGKFLYERYGSIRGYFCDHCGQWLHKPNPQGPIHNNTFTEDHRADGKVYCSNCANVARRV